METDLDKLIPKGKPGRVLSKEFLPRLKQAIADVGIFSRTHPFQSAVGWSFVMITTVLAVLVIVGRVDLLPEFVGFLLRVVGA